MITTVSSYVPAGESTAMLGSPCRTLSLLVLELAMSLQRIHAAHRHCKCAA
jgi:hypothetical protein